MSQTRGGKRQCFPLAWRTITRTRRLERPISNMSGSVTRWDSYLMRNASSPVQSVFDIMSGMVPQLLEQANRL